MIEALNVHRDMVKLVQQSRQSFKFERFKGARTSSDAGSLPESPISYRTEVPIATCTVHSSGDLEKIGNALT